MVKIFGTTINLTKIISPIIYLLIGIVVFLIIKNIVKKINPKESQ